MRVLVVEDSERLRRALQHGLRCSGFTVDVCADGEEGLSYARHGSYDAMVLDLMLPRMTGVQVLRTLRREGSRLHVLILSAKDQVRERIDGLRLGADDYLTKPFDFDELVARLQALVRRKYGAKSPVQHVGPLQIDTARRTVAYEQTDISLTRNEYMVLELLVRHRGRVVTKQQLLDSLYTDTERGSPNAVEVFVHQLRKKIAHVGPTPVVRTVRGHGYIVD